MALSWRDAKGIGRLLGTILIVGILTLAPLEILLRLLASSPSLASTAGLGALAKQLHTRYWAVIQWMPECSRHDPELSYTLRPGRCTFADTEFSTLVEINRLGVRDDDQSLDGPDVIALGDSTTMGWGVQRRETYASLLEQSTGLKVLNAGISSYGTARELMLLARFDRRRTRYIILQYAPNDWKENLIFVNNGYSLPGRAPEWFEKTVNRHRRDTRFVPGGYLAFTVQRILSRILNRQESDDPEAERMQYSGSQTELSVLLEVIDHSPVDLSRFELVVFEFEAAPGGAARSLIPRLRQAINERSKKVHVLDAMREMTPADRYPLDGHLNPSGHRKLARQLLNVIRP